MERAKIFFGPANSNKTRTARELAEGKNFVYICARNPQLFENPFLFSRCDEQTELIIFDDVPAIFDFWIIRQFISTGQIEVNKQCRTPFHINTPEIIITTNHCPENVGVPLFDNYFEVVEFPANTVINPTPRENQPIKS